MFAFFRKESHWNSLNKVITEKLDKLGHEIKIDAWKNYCKNKNIKLYKLHYPWGYSYTLGKPQVLENRQVVFIDAETEKEITFVLGNDDTCTIMEV